MRGRAPFLTVPEWGEEWNALQGAACRDLDPDLFFDLGRSAEAKEVCSICPVMTRCGLLAEKLEKWSTNPGRVWGVYGGETARERIRRRKAGPLAA